MNLTIKERGCLTRLLETYADRGVGFRNEKTNVCVNFYSKKGGVTGWRN